MTTETQTPKPGSNSDDLKKLARSHLRSQKERIEDLERFGDISQHSPDDIPDGAKIVYGDTNSVMFISEISDKKPSKSDRTYPFIGKKRYLEPLQSYCYLVDNNFAYKWDIKDSQSSKGWVSYMKTTNFVPTYDTWCLYCDNRNAKSRCAKCHSVYFCDRNCQQKAWNVHKKHCGRDLFSLCITCGSGKNTDAFLKCPECPVKFCSQVCKSRIFQAHTNFDCSYFKARFT